MFLQGLEKQTERERKPESLCVYYQRVKPPCCWTLPPAQKGRGHAALAGESGRLASSSGRGLWLCC